MSRSYPITLLWPSDTKVAMPRGRWKRLADGQIEATYNSQEELGMALGFAQQPTGSGQQPEGTLEMVDGPMEPMEKPEGPCNVCGATAWWERPEMHGGGWVCGVCHPNPATLRSMQLCS